MKGTN